MIDQKAKKVARIIQAEIPLAKRPYAEIGRQIGLSEEETIEIVGKLKNEGVVRKVGAVVRHRSAGFGANAMVVWAVPAERLEECGRMLASFDAVTHCYERTPAFEGKYTLFSMIHAGEEGVDRVIGDISRAMKIDDFLVLETLEEFKKSSMEYF